MMTETNDLSAHIDRLHGAGLVDMHYDLLMDLFEKRHRDEVLATDYLADLKAGAIGVMAANIYISDEYLPEMGLRVALDQISRVYQEVDKAEDFAICRSYGDIVEARQRNKIALLIAMEGIEPLGMDLDLLRVFYELGLRELSLTHARRNWAGSGGIFSPWGSPRDGLTSFGKDVVRECASLGIILDLAHINPSGFDEVMELTTGPLIVSHTNPRRFYDIERNISDDQIRIIGERNGVVGVGAILLSTEEEETHLDNYVDQILHVADLAGIDSVGLGFDFFYAIFQSMPDAAKEDLADKLTLPHFLPDLRDHSQTRNLTQRLIERGLTDDEIERILQKNFMRIFEELLS